MIIFKKSNENILKDISQNRRINEEKAYKIRQLGDKTLVEVEGTFYVIYFISESPNPEWYDMVNSFLRMNNLQQFIQSKAEEYSYEFNIDGLNQIKDVP